MRGTHIDVTTLERNAHFFWKMLDLPSKTLALFAVAQNQSLRVTLVWRAKCMVFLSKMHVSVLIWQLPDLIWQLLEGKVSVLDERSVDFQKKWAFSMGGTHIEVTTLERNAYFFWKMLDLPSKTLGLFAEAQNRSLRFTLVWRAKCMDFLSKMHVSDLIWQLPDQIWHLLERKVCVLDERSKDFQKSEHFRWEGRTSMSPRSNETHTFFEKCRTSHLKPWGFSRKRRIDS